MPNCRNNIFSHLVLSQLNPAHNHNLKAPVPHGSLKLSTVVRGKYSNSEVPTFLVFISAERIGVHQGLEYIYLRAPGPGGYKLLADDFAIIHPDAHNRFTQKYGDIKSKILSRLHDHHSDKARNLIDFATVGEDEADVATFQAITYLLRRKSSSLDGDTKSIFEMTSSYDIVGTPVQELLNELGYSSQ
ncbi:hypothetical protein M8J77_019076 [Diaphorina citri]|nr:hypothetical protein M8J77_019076 [Diaphorina citri]